MLRASAPIVAIVIAVSSVSTVALASNAANPRPVAQQAGEQKFPMPAAEFRQHVDTRVAHARARLEEHIASKQLPQDQAEARRARFQAAVDQVTAKVDEVCADGTVTQEEAKAVHELARSLMHHHRHGDGQS